MFSLQTRPAASWFSEGWLSAQRWSLLRLLDLGQRIHPRHLKAPHLLTGERGEFEALFFLQREGYTIVERRWRAPELNGDLDLIAWEGEFLCFVEVKTRTARDLTPAASAIDDDKRRMLRQMARAYRRTLPRRKNGPVPVRFDVVSVYWIGGHAECELLRSALTLHPDSGWNDRGQFGV
jgi:putative endonuclease